MIRPLLAALLLTLGIARADGCAVGQTDTPSNHPYCQDGYAIPGLIDYSTYIRVPPTHFTTRALYQAEGVAERTAQSKGYDTSDVDGLVSLLSPVTAGWRFWMKAPDHDWIKVMDVDSAALSDYFYHIVYENSAVELSYPLAVALGDIDWRNADGSRYFNVEVCLTSDDPLGVCGDTALDYRDWFLSTATWDGKP